jgi:hypothetical protein
MALYALNLFDLADIESYRQYSPRLGDASLRSAGWPGFKRANRKSSRAR